MYINEEKTLFGDPKFVSGDLFTSMSRQKVTWEKIQLGALTDPRSVDQSNGLGPQMGPQTWGQCFRVTLLHVVLQKSEWSCSGCEVTQFGLSFAECHPPIRKMQLRPAQTVFVREVSIFKRNSGHAGQRSLNELKNLSHAKL